MNTYSDTTGLLIFEGPPQPNARLQAWLAGIVRQGDSPSSQGFPVLASDSAGVSCNRKKAVKRLAALHRRIARQRSDWLHQLSTGLVNEHPVIAIEDLKVKNMSASARGTVQAPGRRVKQKAGLNRAMLDAAWAEFRRQLQYKTAACGGAVIAVNPAYTSRTKGAAHV